MKFGQVSSVLLALAVTGSDASASSSASCRDKQAADQCQRRVRVNATASVFGLIDDVPQEVFKSFVMASGECLQCVDKSSVRLLGRTGDRVCNVESSCDKCGEPSENKYNCKECCGTCRCMGCEWEYGNDEEWTKNKVCDQCCRRQQGGNGKGNGNGNGNGNGKGNGNNGASSRRLSSRRLSADVDTFFDFNINVCMDDVTPLDPNTNYYTHYERMLQDFQTELQECYEDRETFLESWSSLAADSGIDLSLMARDDAGKSNILFGMNDLDTTNAAVTSYDSSGSHRSTSHMMFYSALGFVTVSAFAVFGTALVVQVLRKRREADEEQAAKWVSELTTVETTNPIAPSTEETL